MGNQTCRRTPMKSSPFDENDSSAKAVKADNGGENDGQLLAHAGIGETLHRTWEGAIS